MPFALRLPGRVVLLTLVLPLAACFDATREIDWVDASPSPSPVADSAPPMVDALWARPEAAPADSALAADRVAAELAEWEATRPRLVRETQRLAALQAVVGRMSAAQDRRAPGGPLPVVQTPPAPNQSLGSGTVPMDAQRCRGSLRIVATPRGQVAAWWSARAGNRVHLLSAWRDQGQTQWRGPIPVDTVDVGSTDARDVPEGVPTGCARPAPGLAVDGANGYVHLAYALVGPEGAGFFYAHQMDPRAAFEPPVPIVYGERLGAAQVTTDGDYVAVVYEDPNSGARPRIAIAVSRTAGHLFERRFTVNAGQSPASDPFVVVRGAALAVGWSEVPPTGGDTVFLVRRATIR